MAILPALPRGGGRIARGAGACPCVVPLARWATVTLLLFVAVVAGDVDDRIYAS